MVGRERGQATIELALLLPLVALLAGCLVEIGCLATDRVRLWHAAREAARVGAVDGHFAAIRDAAGTAGLGPVEVSVDPEGEARIHGEPVTVEVTYTPATTVPVIGRIFSGTMTARATMRIEQP